MSYRITAEKGNTYVTRSLHGRAIKNKVLRIELWEDLPRLERERAMCYLQRSDAALQPAGEWVKYTARGRIYHLPRTQFESTRFYNRADMTEAGK